MRRQSIALIVKLCASPISSPPAEMKPYPLSAYVASYTSTGVVYILKLLSHVRSLIQKQMLKSPKLLKLNIVFFCFCLCILLFYFEPGGYHTAQHSFKLTT